MLRLRGTFPSRDGLSPATRQRIPLGISATPEGLAIAESKAVQVRVQINTNTFNWGDYLDISLPSLKEKTIAELIADFEADYFIKRARNPKSEDTYKIDYQSVFKKLPGDALLTPQVIIVAIASTHPDTRTRKRYCLALGALAKFAGLDFDTTSYTGTYGINTTSTRSIPIDEEIEKCFFTIKNDAWRWVFGMLATYGLRPHEVFRLDYDLIARGGQIAQVLEGKTGSRLVFPIYPRWYEEFDLQQVELPNVNRERPNSAVGHEVTQKFWRYKLGIKPYDLRHAWAIRSLLEGIEVAMAAQMMGHSLALHTKLYHKWIQEFHYKKAFAKYMERQ
ncbi:MAG: site-specific integrase [Oscillatoriaceae bacterium SKW80]|nr:site-specific integrase [Oscillatoriaceae bacterium SKW80]